VLALWLERACRIPVGRLGEFAFPAGWVLYVGSALGPGGLAARLGRHRRRFASGKRPHWHVDYVREHAVWGGAWARRAGGRLEGDGARRNGERLECDWAAALGQRPGARIVVPGFGASDCRCPGHLVHLPALPDEAWMASILGAERVVVGMDELDELLETLVSGDDDSREAAAIALGRFGATAVAPLAALLAGPDADARWWAARALAEVGTGGAVPPLLLALDDPVPDVRACAGGGSSGRKAPRRKRPRPPAGRAGAGTHQVAEHHRPPLWGAGGSELPGALLCAPGPGGPGRRHGVHGALRPDRFF
jgi:Uri superfamily endonuclease